MAKGSPLETLLETQKAARDVDGYGIRKHGHLLPEGVPFGDLMVGRFEVTRAQWTSYEASMNGGVAPSVEQGDLPASHISLEQAQAYVQWLAKLTGEGWRLPTLEEAKRFAGKGGNTLNWWLGYEANPDDAKSAIHQLEDTSMLLRPVGSHGGTLAPGRQIGPKVFDLDGNVAEWAVTKGKQQAIGASAERPASSSAEPDERFIGLRVVRDR